jgi:Beta-propeller repeat/Abnormal spindle-like microcephaly-assoc'd, ASPM-SPD-2-Hydin
MKSLRLPCLLTILLSAVVVAQSNSVPLMDQPLAPKHPVPAGLSQPDPLAQGKIVESYGKLPLSFEANQGQTDAGVKFLSRGSGYTLFLTDDEAVFSWRGREPKPNASPVTDRLHPKAVVPKTGAVLRMKLVKANHAAKMTGSDELPGKSNYFIGNDPKKWRSNLPTYAKVKYEGVYPGIDLVYYGNQRQLEYDFIVAPGADPVHIQFDVRGAKKIRRDKDGDLLLQVGDGEVRWRKPGVYQEKDGRRQEIDGRYVIKHGRRMGFELAAYDSKRPLIIDPILGYSTYLGGSNADQGYGISVDGSGDAYVTGVTQSPDFPTMNPLQSANAGSEDAFVTELNPAGSALVYSTYLGGSSNDQGFGIAVDSSGNAYVTGVTSSPDFPITPGAFQTTLSGSGNAFLTKLNPSGSALVYSTYLGGGGDSGQGIALDSSGDAYLTGSTSSPNFPTTPGAFQTTCGGGCNGTGDAFVTELNPAASALVYSTYLGGSSNDQGFGIAVDSSGNAYVTGATSSTDFPTTPGAFQTALSGSGNAFLTKLNPSGSALVYSTYLGGGGDSGQGIALDSSGDAYLTGSTSSSNFPTTPGAFQTTCGGGCNSTGDAFVTELNPTASALVYSTYLGGSSNDQGFGIAVDSSGNAYVTGATSSPDFPLMNPAQPNYGGQTDGFVAEVNPSGSALVYSTYLGGSSNDQGSGIAVDSSGNAYVTGATSSTDFPTTTGAFQTACGGGCSPYPDAFVAKLSPSPFVMLSPSSLNFGNQNVGTSSTPQNITLTNSGNAVLNIGSIVTSGDFSQTNTCPVGGGLPAGSNCTISVTFTPTAEGTRNGSVMIADNAPGSPQSAPLTGVGSAPLVTLSPTSLNFGNQPVGVISGPQTSTVMNTGNATLIITSIQVTGTNSGDFAQSNNCGTSVPAGGTCTVTVTFTPSLVGSESASVTITDNAPDSPESLPLTGTGTPPVVTLSPPSLTFGPQPVGTTSFPQTVTLSASGALSFNSIAASAEFLQSNNCGSGIPAGGSCQVNVTFTPTAPGLQNGTLMITDSGAGSPQSVPLSGVGTQGTAITTHHYNNLRTGWNNTETLLTPANVQSSSFGMLQSIALDAQVDAQPLFVPNQPITAGNYQGTYDVVYVASEGNTIYAIDANSGQVLLSPNFGAPVPAPLGCSVDPVVGINSTPVIDLSTGTMYVIIYTNGSNGPVYTIHALDLGSLADKVAPVVVAASHSLTDGSTFNFNATYQRQRPALLLANGVVYAAFGSFCDKGQNLSRGWLLGWQAGSLTPLAGDQIFDTQATSPDTYFLSSIWMSGSGIAADQSGNLYLLTGNSDRSGTTYDGVTDIQESIIKVSADLSQVVDLFTPYDWSTLDQNDTDFGSGGVMLLPPQPRLTLNGPVLNLAVAAGKEGNMFLMSQDDLGGYDPNGNNVLGTFNIGPCWCVESYFVDPVDGPRVVSSGGATVGIWKIVQTAPTVTLAKRASSAVLFHKGGGFFTTVSSNGTANPIIWALGLQTLHEPQLNFYAFEPEAGGKTLKQIFASTTPGTWPYSGNANLIPVVANGQVFIASGGQLTIFGLSDPSAPAKRHELRGIVAH